MKEKIKAEVLDTIWGRARTSEDERIIDLTISKTAQAIFEDFGLPEFKNRGYLERFLKTKQKWCEAGH